jgi:hypothetical protein
MEMYLGARSGDRLGCTRITDVPNQVADGHLRPISDRGWDRAQMAIAGNHSLPVIDPDLPAAKAVQRLGVGIALGQGAVL